MAQHSGSFVPMMMAKTKAKKSKPKKSAASGVAKVARGFGAPAKGSNAPLDKLLKQANTLSRACSENSADAMDPRTWIQLAAEAANLEEYAEARVIMEAGMKYCGGEEKAAIIAQALGQMRRTGPLAELKEAAATLDWPGKGDESPYNPDAVRFQRYSSPEWPKDCPRGTMYPSGSGAIALSTTAVLDPDECSWVVKQAERTAREKWVSDHANAANIGKDMIWAKGFPDRLWLREVPGLIEWFEHRLRTRLFPMLQGLYPEAIPSADALRCHDAFISRYDADGMASLEVHQDTTDFTFTIALNPADDYDGGGTLFPSIKPVDDDGIFRNLVVKPDVGCVASFPGRLHHGGNAITRGERYIIPLFIYLDVNKLSGKPRGWVLAESGIQPAQPTGLDVYSPNLLPRGS